MELEKIQKSLTDNAMDIALGTGVAVVSLHVARRMPRYSGWVTLGAGLLGLMAGGKVVKTASIVAASLGVVGVMNTLAQENGVPAISGLKGTINKIVPQLNPGGGIAGFGDLSSVSSMNERLLSGDDEVNGLSGEEDMQGLNAGIDDLTGLGDADLNRSLVGLDSVM